MMTDVRSDESRGEVQHISVVLEHVLARYEVAWSMGNFNGDMAVNSSDAALLGGKFGFQNTRQSQAGQSTVVPEPNGPRVGDACPIRALLRAKRRSSLNAIHTVYKCCR